MKFIFKLFACCLFILATLPSIAGSASKFDSIEKTFESLSDYTVKMGNLRIIDNSIPSIALYTTVLKHDSVEGIKSEARRALLYGVYRTFIHTKHKKVKVTVYPMLTNMDTGSKKELSIYKKTITVEREKALSVIQLLSGVLNFDSLVTDMKFGNQIISDMWSKDFEKLYYNRSRTKVWLDKLAR